MSRRQPTRRYPRVARVNEVVREVLAEELKRLSDPRLALVTVTGVDVKSDLRTATVYYSSLARTDEEKQDVVKALGRASTHFRQVLGREVRLKNTPALAFVVDPAIEAGERIDAVLRSLERKEAEVASEAVSDAAAGSTSVSAAASAAEPIAAAAMQESAENQPEA